MRECAYCSTRTAPPSPRHQDAAWSLPHGVKEPGGRFELGVAVGVRAPGVGPVELEAEDVGGERAGHEHDAEPHARLGRPCEDHVEDAGAEERERPFVGLDGLLDLRQHLLCDDLDLPCDLAEEVVLEREPGRATSSTPSPNSTRPPPDYSGTPSSWRIARSGSRWSRSGWRSSCADDGHAACPFPCPRETVWARSGHGRNEKCPRPSVSAGQ